MELDPNQLLNSLIAGGAVWLAIKTEIRLIWRDIDILRKQIVDKK